VAKRSDILTHYKTRIAALAGMHAERVRIGVLDPTKIPMGAPVVGIRVASDRGERQEGLVVRRMVLIVSAFLRVDPIKSADELLQLSDAWDLVQAELELIADACANGLAVMITEDPQGIAFDDFDDKDHYTFAASAQVIEYTRGRGAVS
jgi:hypothetical protein